MHTRVGIVLLLALAVLSITLLYASKGPMQSSHWDAPIYLERSKEVVETSVLRDYALYAEVIAAHLPAFKAEPDSYTPYWGFMRLGNTLMLATASAWSDRGLENVQAAYILYTLIWVAGIVLAGLMAHRIVILFAPELSAQSVAVTVGTVLAVLLYVISDVSRYMSGNFVAEVPALLWLTASAYLLLQALERRSFLLAGLSGLFGFALYLTKMDAVWVYITFLVVLAGMLVIQRRVHHWWPAFMVSGASAAVLYAIYAWYYWPLADPRLFLIYVDAHEIQAANPVAPFKLWAAAGGLLWLGILASVLHGRNKKVLGFALAWLLLMTLPHLSGLLAGRFTQVQVRMYSLNILPLMAAATYGMANLYAGIQQGRIGKSVVGVWLAALLFLGLLSHTESYRWLRELPGGWRLQQVRVFLSVPPYERIDYPLDQLASISQALYGLHGSSVLILDKQVPEEYLNLIAYMGPAPRQSNVALYALPPAVDLGQCGKRTIRFDRSDVFFCLEPPEETRRLVEKGIHLLRLERATHSPVSGQVLARTAGLSLVRLN